MMRAFRDLHRNLQLRILIIFLSAFCYGTVFSSMAIYYNQHVGAALTGVFLSISALATFVSGLIAGYFSDRQGRKPVMAKGATLQALGAMLALASNVPGHVNPWTTFIGFLLISFGHNMDLTAGNAMIIDDSTPENRRTVFMINYWAQNLSVILGAALGAWLFKPAFFLLLVILLLTILVMLSIVVFFLKETFSPTSVISTPSVSECRLSLSRSSGKSSRSSDRKHESMLSAYRTVAKDKTYMIFTLANIFTASIIMQFDNFLPVHLANSFRTIWIFGLEIYGQRMLTIFLMLACVMVVFLMTPLAHWTRNWSHRRGFIFGSIFMAVGMVFAFMTQTFTPIFIAGVIYTFGEIIYTPSVQSLAADLMDPEKIGAYNGIGAIRMPIASIIAAGLVSASPVIHEIGGSTVLMVTELAAIVLVSIAIARHQRSENASVSADRVPISSENQ